MSTIQMIGIGIATGILIILVIALIITRRRDAGAKPKKVKESKSQQQRVVPPSDLTPETASFMEGAPRDDLHMLHGDKPPEATTAAPGVPAAAAAAAAALRAEDASTGSPSSGGEPVLAGAVASGAAGESGHANDLWAEQSKDSAGQFGAPVDLWGSAAATADAEVAAAGTEVPPAQGETFPMADVVPAEPFVAVQPAAPETGLPEQVAGTELPMFTATASDGGPEGADAPPEPATPAPVIPFSTEPPPPWEQEVMARPPAEPEPFAEASPAPWASAGAPATEETEFPVGEPAMQESPAPYVVEPIATSSFAEPAVAPSLEQPVAPAGPLMPDGYGAPGGSPAGEPPAATAAAGLAAAGIATASGAASEEAAAETMPLVKPAAAFVEPAVPVSAAEPPVAEPAYVPPVAEPAGDLGGQEPADAQQAKVMALNDIISTTNQQRVDLSDPEVRRMLKELAKSEIDLAQQYKQLGQNIDAVLQLTEAKKICEALDMTSHAKLIEQMIQELRG